MDCWINQCHTHVDKHQSEVRWLNLCGADLADLVAHALPSITVHHAQGECLWSRSHSQSKGASAGRSEVRGPVCSHSSTESLSLFTVTSSTWLKYWLIIFSIKKKWMEENLVNVSWLILIGERVIASDPLESSKVQRLLFLVSEWHCLNLWHYSI